MYDHNSNDKPWRFDDAENQDTPWGGGYASHDSTYGGIGELPPQEEVAGGQNSTGHADPVPAGDPSVPEAGPAYTEPIIAEESRPVPVYAAYGSTKQGESEKKGKKRSPGFKAAIACAAVVAMLGSSFLGGMAAVNLMDSNNADTAADNNAAETDSSSAYKEAMAVTPVADGSTLTASEIYALACQQVVSITSDAGAGTGFVYSADGYIITNYHVVSDAVNSGTAAIQVSFYDGNSYTAEYLGGDSDSDVAILKIDATGLNASTLGDSNNMTVGEDIYVVGNAMGELDYTMTSGVISALDRDIEVSDATTGATATISVFQIDAAVNSGNSGGPVYNAQGQVIGIVTAKWSSASMTSASVEGLGFAIPINNAASVLADLIEYGYVTGKPQLGVSAGTVDSMAIQYYGLPQGAYVNGVTADSGAEKAGIQAQDIITKLGDAEIASASDLKASLRSYKAGDTVLVTLYRNGETLELSVTLDESVQTDSSDTATQNSQEDTSGSNEGSSGYGWNPYGS